MTTYKSVDTKIISYHALPEDILREESVSVLPLVRKLCRLLDTENITYCHWKSNNMIERSATGDNDLDLLVSRADVTRFTEILFRLGFKQASAAPEKQIPAVLDYFGFDDQADRLIHVHAHYQLILGHDMTKNYRLPIEKQFLESAVQGDLFKIPAPEYEFIVFVVRMVLKHSTWEAILGREQTMNSAERNELSFLQSQIELARVDTILNRYLPYIGVKLFDRCMQTLQPAASIWTRMKTGQQLQSRLAGNARRPLFVNTSLKLWRRVSVSMRRRIFGYSFKYRLDSGGALIALVGGDGAGKSTAVDGLSDWLSEYFATTSVHMGKPDWSWTTKLVRGLLKIGNLLGLIPEESTYQATLTEKSLLSPGYPWLLREVCRARDRHATYMKARRFAANGGFAICDRFTMPQIQIMDGPLTEQFIDQLEAGPQANLFMSPHKTSRLAKALVKIEKSYYQQVVLPELLIVLRVDPEIAVQRKTDEEASSVRRRSTAIWKLDWKDTGAMTIDASKSKGHVMAELKKLLWSEL